MADLEGSIGGGLISVAYFDMVFGDCERRRTSGLRKSLPNHNIQKEFELRQKSMFIIWRSCEMPDNEVSCRKIGLPRFGDRSVPRRRIQGCPSSNVQHLP